MVVFTWDALRSLPRQEAETEAGSQSLVQLYQLGVSTSGYSASPAAFKRHEWMRRIPFLARRALLHTRSPRMVSGSQRGLVAQ